jgi:hypothetical protein
MSKSKYFFSFAADTVFPSSSQEPTGDPMPLTSSDKRWGSYSSEVSKSLRISEKEGSGTEEGGKK